jgi:hypothetical protein
MEFWSSLENAELVKKLNARLEECRHLNYSELTSFPECFTIPLGDNPESPTLSTYRVTLESAVQIIVQIHLKGKRFLGLFPTSQLAAKGICVNSEGSIEEMKDEELYEYT